MSQVSSILRQLLDLVPRPLFEEIVRRHLGERHVRGLGCRDEFVAMLFCQLVQAFVLRSATVRRRFAIGPCADGEVAVHAGDILERNMLRADGLAEADVGTAAEALFVGLVDHFHGTVVAFGLTLREQAEMGDFGGGE